MSNFELHKYPYFYKCDCCGRKSKLSKEKEFSLKQDYDIESELPLFFICKKCGQGTLKPIGYTGRESIVMLNLGFWDLIVSFFKK